MKRTDYQWISVTELEQQLESTSDMLLIHTLPDEHFQQAHIPKAVHACVYEVTFLDQVAELAAGTAQDIVVYGSRETSWDARTAADKLTAAGYRNVRILEGGLAGWVSAGLPTVGSATAPVTDFGNAPSLTAGTYRVDVAESTIEWTGRNSNGKHFGTITLAGGQATLTPDSISGSFEIDMTSIRNTDLSGDELYPVLIAHLESDDFFLSRVFPKAVFSITSGTQIPSPTLTMPNFVIRGDLELRGIQADLEFMASVAPVENNGIAVESHFDIDRTRWGLRYGSSRFFDHLGKHVVFDLISIDLRIIGRRE
ncbi:hypothetical protein D3OALGA1CA_4575 [Olavius algarvensis associated proteobacterium Delta 3]|nr:hypothetical protein D3OALGA1CA_4575 [Olavius algarvensis associated proteobacterium Delta 3]